jgi:hypothetical protein
MENKTTKTKTIKLALATNCTKCNKGLPVGTRCTWALAERREDHQILCSDCHPVTLDG